MKIAVACEQDMVTEHFGYSESFNIFEVNADKILNKESVPNPGHKPGFLPRFLHDLGVDVIISGGMGYKAVSLFNEQDIEVIIGAQGKDVDLVNNYLKGKLESTGSICHQPNH